MLACLHAGIRGDIYPKNASTGAFNRNVMTNVTGTSNNRRSGIGDILQTNQIFFCKQAKFLCRQVKFLTCLHKKKKAQDASFFLV